MDFNDEDFQDLCGLFSMAWKFVLCLALCLALSFFIWRLAEAAEIQRWTGIVVHWSDSSAMTLEQCDEWHNAKGWNGCGYNFIIQRSGAIDEGRGLERIGAHAKGYNSQFLGICFVGNSAPTPEQLEAWKIIKYRLEDQLGRLPVVTHQAIGSTECPGPDLVGLVENGTL